MTVSEIGFPLSVTAIAVPALPKGEPCGRVKTLPYRDDGVPRADVGIRPYEK